MRRIPATWKRLKREGHRALIPFITAGYPTPTITRDAVMAAADSGADLIEIGVPFSDPLADGPAIQASSQAALDGGMDLSGILRLVDGIRNRTDVPLLLMGYYNPFLRYGLPAFCRDARAAGVDGLIVPDLPPEEAGPLKAQARRQGLSMVFLIAPTTTPTRVRQIASASTDFCYCVAVTGVTGTRRTVEAHTEAYLRRVRRLISRPMVVGFGISKPEHVRRLGRIADGLVVGSALVPVLGGPGGRGAVRRNLQRVLKPLVRTAHEQ